MAPHAAIGVDDDLAPRQTRIACRPADHKAPCRIDKILCTCIEKAGRFEHGPDDLLYERVPDFFIGQIVAAIVLFMLLREHDGGNPNGPIPIIFDRHLALAVGAHPGDFLSLAQRRSPLKNSMGKKDGCRHELWRLVAGKPEHHALVARALFPRIFFETTALDPLRDIRRLVVDRVEHRHRLPVEPVIRIIIAYVAHYRTCDFLNVDIGPGRNLAAHKDHSRCGEAFARDMAVLVFRKTGVEHRVGNLVADLVGMAFRYRFGCKWTKKSLSHVCPL